MAEHDTNSLDSLSEIVQALVVLLFEVLLIGVHFEGAFLSSHDKSETFAQFTNFSLLITVLKALMPELFS